MPSVIALACAALLSTAAAGLQLENPTITPVGAILRSGEHVLIVTSGEPVAGGTTAGELRIVAGFPATLHEPAHGSAVFANGFERMEER